MNDSKPIPFIDLKTQFLALEKEIRAAMDKVLEHGQYIMGPEIKQLEDKLAAYVGVPHALTTASGTDSLEIALRALDIGPGDEVITVPFTWISTAEVIGQVGARPVFIDIEADTYNMDPDLLEAAITPRTKAIMPVSLFGQMANYERINEIAAKHGITVIEDAAQSFGATRHGKRSCGVTTIAATSFFPAKPLGCYGDGGALFTTSAALDEKMKAIRNHGGLVRHHHTCIGMNGRFDTLQAAVVLVKLTRFDWEVERRNAIGARYTELLRPLLDERGLGTTPVVAPGNTHVYAQYTIRSVDRDALQARLKAANIPTAIYYPKCIHEQPAFAYCGYKLGDFPVSEKASREVVSLPMHPDLSEDDLQRITKAVAAVPG